MRFDVMVGPGTAGRAPGVPQPTGLVGSDGRYSTRFAALGLHAGQETALRLETLRDGRPAPDVTPFLGVAAHAVFIDAMDLTYVHVHATPAAAPDAGGTKTPMRHDTAGMGDTGDDEHEGMAGMGGPALRLGERVPPALVMHVLAPKAGTYLLWMQFMAGGAVRTVPFVLRVT